MACVNPVSMRTFIPSAKQAGVWSRPCSKGSEQPGGGQSDEWLVTGFCVNMCHPWVMENGHSSLDSAKKSFGETVQGTELSPAQTAPRPTNLILNSTGLGLPGGFSIITAAVRTSGTVILIYMIYGNTVCNDSSIYKQD